MAKRFYIIDGYNFLHEAGMMPRVVGPRSLQRARRRLSRFLEKRLSDVERERTVIVYDVHTSPEDQPEQETVFGMRVYYALAYPDADTQIEELIQQHSAPKQLTVVSSDHRLHKAARARKAQPMDSDQFYEKIKNRPVRGHSKPDATVEQDLSDLDYNPDLPEAISSGIQDDLELWEKRIKELDEEL